MERTDRDRSQGAGGKTGDQRDTNRCRVHRRAISRGMDESADRIQLSTASARRHPSGASLCQYDDETGQVAHRVFLNGNVVAQILSTEKAFDLKALATRLEKVFPTMVKLYEDKGFIWVMDKVKLTEKGVVEGSGPAAERVQRVYEHFISEAKAR